MTLYVPDAVLDAYAHTAKEYGPGQAEATALRTNSVAMRDVLVYAATGGEMRRYRDLLDDVALATTLHPRWAAALARVIALQSPTDEEELLARELLAVSLPRLPRTPGVVKYRKLQAELLFDAQRFREVDALLTQDPELAQVNYGYLTADLYNPYAGSPYGEYAKWLPLFNLPFVDAGLEPVEVLDGGGSAFDRLASAEHGGNVEGPLVSVVVTTFRPERAGLLAAVQSILHQTWRNLDIIVVDDASPEEYDPLLRKVESLDPRIRVRKLETNGGTYIARNVGIEMALGELITCQDSDDYSHQRRIELQAGPLLEDPAIPGTRSYCVAVQADLSIHRRGYLPLRANASSLMFRTETARRLGGFLRARKGADSEFHSRLERYAGRAVRDIRDPLALIRILPDSLSRSDFRSGWHHHARRHFRMAYKAWHGNSSAKELELRNGAKVPIEIPQRLAVNRSQMKSLDVVFLADWRLQSAKQVLYLQFMRDLSMAGISVGAMHLDSTWFIHQRLTDASPQLHHAIASGMVERVLLDDARKVRKLVVLDPTVVQFPPRDSSALDVAESVLLLGESLDGVLVDSVQYDVDSCRASIEGLFSAPCEVRTIGFGAESESRRGSAQALRSAGQGLVRFATDRSTPASTHAPTVGFELPLERGREKAVRGLARLYTSKPALEVRLIGFRSPTVFKHGRAFPGNSVYFGYDELDWRTFIGSVDFLIVDGGRPIAWETLLLAVAGGALVVSVTPVPEPLSSLMTFCAVEDLGDLVYSLWRDREQFRELQAMARAHLGEFSACAERSMWNLARSSISEVVDPIAR